nr:MAG TPA: hypothetical protein [Caudoviricetes sp.]
MRGHKPCKVETTSGHSPPRQRGGRSFASEGGSKTQLALNIRILLHF